MKYSLFMLVLSVMNNYTLQYVTSIDNEFRCQEGTECCSTICICCNKGQKCKSAAFPPKCYYSLNNINETKLRLNYLSEEELSEKKKLADSLSKISDFPLIDKIMMCILKEIARDPKNKKEFFDILICFHERNYWKLLRLLSKLRGYSKEIYIRCKIH